MKRIKLLIFAGALITLAGCAPKADAVCQHMINVMGDQEDKPSFLRDMDACTERFENAKKRHGVNSYRREVECLLGVDTSYKMRTCIENEKFHRD